MSAESFLAFADPLPEAMLLCGGEGVIQAANLAAGELLRRRPRDLAGRPLTDLAAGGHGRLRRFLADCARSRQLLPGVLELTAGSGAGLKLRADGAVVQPRQGASEALVVLRLRPQERAVDRFTLLNQRIEELSREIVRRKKAEVAADRAQDEFLATLSHELRAPLQAIGNWTFLLGSQEPDPDTLARALDAIERNLEIQTRLVEDLLDASHLAAGQVSVERCRILLTPVVEAACADLSAALASKDIRLSTDLERGIEVSGDRERLRQVVRNLLSNALKFTPEGGEVEVRLEKLEDGARITVTDTGEGIGSEAIDHVFDRFHQADGSRTRSHGGLGLGLTIARHLVELHGGTLEGESQGAGRGATFTVTLPGTTDSDAA